MTQQFIDRNKNIVNKTGIHMIQHAVTQTYNIFKKKLIHTIIY